MENPDMMQYMGVFLDEAREQLELLETNILQMERGDTSTEILQVLFRAAHTVKGSSRAMGFTVVGDLTHHMEDVLDDLRNGRQVVTTEAVNVLLSCLDTLTVLIDDVASTGTTTPERDADVAGLVAGLDALCSRDGAPAAAAEALPANTVEIVVSDYERTAIDEALASGLNVYRVGIGLSADCLMKSVRAYMVLSALGEIGTVLVSSPNEDQLDAEDFDLGIEMLFAGNGTADEIRDALGRIAELAEVSVEPWSASRDGEGAPARLTASRGSEGAPARLTASRDGEGAPARLPAVAASETPVLPMAAPIVATPSGADPRPAVRTADTGHAQTIRVDVARLDNLLNLIGEMVIDRTQITRLGKDLRERYRQDDLIEQLIEGTDRLARITSELQDQIMKARMLPIDGVFQRMPRMVRDLAQKTGKEIQLVIEGGETELDRSVLEVLGDPLIHLLRNSVDHGIEPPDQRAAIGKPSAGSIKMSARHEENHIVIEINDDGRGIDAPAIRAAAVAKGTITRAEADLMTEHDALMLIFASGVSTAKNLSDISGRGVGMDIVRSNLERLGGRIQVDTRLGVGTTFTIRLPLTLAIVRGLTVEAGGGTYVFPLSCVDEMLRLGSHDGGVRRHSAGGQAAIVLRDRTVPVINLAGALSGDPHATSTESVDPNAYVVVIGLGAKKIGITVDALCGEQEVVIKSLGTFLGDVAGIAGATILGDGSVALIVDVAKLASSINDINVVSNPAAKASMGSSSGVALAARK